MDNPDSIGIWNQILVCTRLNTCIIVPVMSFAPDDIIMDINAAKEKTESNDLIRQYVRKIENGKWAMMRRYKIVSLAYRPNSSIYHLRVIPTELYKKFDRIMRGLFVIICRSWDVWNNNPYLDYNQFSMQCGTKRRKIYLGYITFVLELNTLRVIVEKTKLPERIFLQR